MVALEKCKPVRCRTVINITMGDRWSSDSALTIHEAADGLKMLSGKVMATPVAG